MSFLDNVQLAFQCPLRWEKLVGGERERYCSTCEKHVHNISAMSRGEAKRFLAAQQAPICIRVEVDAQGRAIHRPGLGAIALAASLAACGVDDDSAVDSGGGIGITEAYAGGTAVGDAATVGQAATDDAGSGGAGRGGAHTIAEVEDSGLVGKIKVQGETPADPIPAHAVEQPRQMMMGGMPANIVHMGKPQVPTTPPPPPVMGRMMMGEPAAPPPVEKMGDYAAPSGEANQ